MKTIKKLNEKTINVLTFSNLKKAALLLALPFLMQSCDKDSVANDSTPAVKEQSVLMNQSGTQRYYGSIIVRNWGSHNVDCSQPNGFCYDVWTFYSYDMLYTPQPDGSTPGVVSNVEGKFSLKVFKTALTRENAATFLGNGSYYVPEGQDIKPELVRAYGFTSKYLQPGNYRIVDNGDSYVVTIDVLR